MGRPRSTAIRPNTSRRSAQVTSVAVVEPVRGREIVVPCTEAPNSGSDPEPDPATPALVVLDVDEVGVDVDDVDDVEVELDVDDVLEVLELDVDDVLEVLELDVDELEVDEELDDDELDELELDEDEELDDEELDDELEPAPGGGAAMTVHVMAAGSSATAVTTLSWTFQSWSSWVAEAGPFVQAIPTLKSPAGTLPGEYTPRLKAGMFTIGPGPPAVVALAVWASTKFEPVTSKRG
jgi:hypothetical protein